MKHKRMKSKEIEKTTQTAMLVVFFFVSKSFTTPEGHIETFTDIVDECE